MMRWQIKSTYGLVFISLLVFLGVYFTNQPADNLSANLIELRVRGDSMEPTLQNGQMVKLDTEYYKNHPVQRGDIIAFKFVTIDTPYVKRVIAIPGDKVELKNKERIVSSNSYYVLSDNRLRKEDSRKFGFVPEKYIIGKVIY